MEICGALAYQDAEGVENDGWLNPKDEPALMEILELSGTLDADANHPDKWQQLFDSVERVK